MAEHKRLQKIQLILAALVLTVGCILPAVQAKAAVLATPAGLKQTAASSTGIQYAWNAVSGATQYGCSYSADGKTWSTEVMEPSTMHVFSGLAGGKTYYVRVRAYNGSAWGGYSANFAVSTSPKACDKLVQTDAATNSVEILWSAVEGASGYNVWFAKGKEPTKLIKTTAATTTSLIIKGLTADTKYTVEVVPFITTPSKFQACAQAKQNKSIVTMAPRVKNLSLKLWNPATGDISIGWKNSAKYEDGYEIELLSPKGKRQKVFTVAGKSAKVMTQNTKKLLKTGGRVRVRAYKVINGNKCYGDWSDEKIIVPQAATTAQKLSATSVQINWTQITGAKSYTIYYSTQPNQGYQKLTTVNGNVTSFTFQNMKPNTTYYVYVSANSVKIGKKKYSSSKVLTKSPVVVTNVVQTVPAQK